MIGAMATERMESTVHADGAAEAALVRCAQQFDSFWEAAPSRRPEWPAILREALGHRAYCIEVRQGSELRGCLPLCYVSTKLFGKFLVGLPYLNVGGVVARDQAAAIALIDQAVTLADELDVRYLELRHEARWSHPALNAESTQKVNMRLDLPSSCDELWRQFNPKVRNQIRKAEQNELTVSWGGRELLDDFYTVFAINMRDLGTPTVRRHAGTPRRTSGAVYYSPR
jgi:hypothetical protein